MSGEQGYGADAADGSQQQQQQNATIAKFTDEAIKKFIKAYAEHKEVQQHQGDLHGYLMVLATLTASITYTAALTPPGGFWGGDDKGHIPGTPILRDTFRDRYLAFYFCNVMSFASSLCIIVILANRKLLSLFKQLLFTLLVSDAMGLIGAFIAGSTTEVRTSVLALMVCIMVSLVILLTACITNRQSSRRLC